jgi:hypothetical protein
VTGFGEASIMRVKLVDTNELVKTNLLPGVSVALT